MLPALLIARLNLNRCLQALKELRGRLAEGEGKSGGIECSILILSFGAEED